MRLIIAPIGKEGKVRKIDADEKTRNRLRNVGIIEGGELEVTRCNFGDVIVRVKDCRIALNKDVAKTVDLEVG